MTRHEETALRQSIERQNKNLQELLGMMQEHPELPVIPMVDSEIVCDDGYSWWSAAWGYAHRAKICVAQEHIVEYDESDLWDTFESVGFDYDDCGITDEMDDAAAEQRAKELLAELEWLDCILVNITLPDDTMPDNTDRVRDMQVEE